MLRSSVRRATLIRRTPNLNCINASRPLLALQPPRVSCVDATLRLPTLSRAFASVSDVDPARYATQSDSSQELPEEVPQQDPLNELAELAVALVQSPLPPKDDEKLQLVHQVLQNMQFYLMYHLRPPGTDSATDSEDPAFQAEYYEKLVTSPMEPFSDIYRIRQVILSLHSSMARLLSSIPSNSPELEVNLGYGKDDEGAPSLAKVVEALQALQEGVSSCWEWTQVSALRFRILQPAEAEQIGIPPVTIVRDSEQEALDKERDSPEFNGDIQKMTDSEKESFLQDTKDAANNDAFLRLWMPLFNELTFTDELLSVFLTVKNDPTSVELEEAREHLEKIIGLKAEEMQAAENAN